MTFSTKCKNELSRAQITKKCCALAELSALIRVSAYISIKGYNVFNVEFSSENASIARRIFKIIKFLYNISCEIVVKKTNRLKKRNNYSVLVKEDIASKMLVDTKLSNTEEINILDFYYGIPKELTKSECCKKAYIRGMFLGCGSISDPEKSYHVEFVNEREKQSKKLEALLNRYDLGAKTIERKDLFITYIKDSEKIIDLLNIMGAYNSLLNIENIKVFRQTKNSINRIINCENANIDRVVNASLRQRMNILTLQKYKALDNLPGELREIAYLRIEHENASLKELGEMLDPPLGKSGVNHRLKKLYALAEEILMREARLEWHRKLW